MIDFDKYMIAEEGLFSKIARKLEEKEKLQQQKLREQKKKEVEAKRAAVDVDEFYSQFRVSPGQRDALRKAMFEAIVKETDKIISSVNRNKSMMTKLIESGRKRMKANYDDDEYYELMKDEISGSEKFTCEPDPYDTIFIGNDFSQEGCCWIVADFIEDFLCPELRKKFSSISRVVKFRLGGDGDEGALAIDFSF